MRRGSLAEGACSEDGVPQDLRTQRTKSHTQCLGQEDWVRVRSEFGGVEIHLDLELGVGQVLGARAGRGVGDQKEGLERADWGCRRPGLGVEMQEAQTFLGRSLRAGSVLHESGSWHRTQLRARRAAWDCRVKYRSYLATVYS